MTVPHVARRILAPSNPTMLPFLYQTRTILGYAANRTRISKQFHVQPSKQLLHTKRYDDRTERSNPAHEVPFENEGDLAFHQQRHTTITDKERRVFEKLYEDFSSQAGASMGLSMLPSEDSDSSYDSLDSILNSAIRQQDTSLEESRAFAANKKPAGYRAEQARRAVGKQSRYGAAVDRPETPLRKAQKEQFDRVFDQLKSAKTDVELWSIMESEVFSAIRRLNLDDTEDVKQNIKEATSSKRKGPSEMAIIGPNYAAFCLVAMRQLRIEFPSSTLGLALLPTIKSLGRGSFALGASTQLYNELIAMTWLTYLDFQGVDDLLQEMDNSGLDFDASTLDLLESIRKSTYNAMNGHQGFTTSIILEMQRFQQGLRRITRWKNETVSRLEREAIRRAKEREEMAI
ncbi:uncharacterized protein K452DRAFT_282284 [Aplosporella prunicola CBS 121167]|uniref:Mtf2-like C-terminal domain-containing protein n=1 Tax=Aplosporella prunicola CBS 121167 TaxID=1176127 RepID=A0A6A6BT40_9PEZI|nr:uncharacterized protein K452DRAFT_282284 [Aplosporella prunicola CBS 121167]KAF2147292.1 hypothetical protein K452DRAFT_282284 [Aplosporella prunicola CBS 121167]